MEQQVAGTARPVRHLFVKHFYSCRLFQGVHTQYHHIKYFVLNSKQLQDYRRQGTVQVFPCSCQTYQPFSETITVDTHIQFPATPEKRTLPQLADDRPAPSAPQGPPQPLAPPPAYVEQPPPRVNECDPDDYTIFPSPRSSRLNPPNH